jgi:dephospho-CoA kinase
MDHWTGRRLDFAFVTGAAGKPVIGLVGGIGSGKSEVAAMLAAAGCTVSDSDALIRKQYAMPEVRSQLQAWWGPGILDDSGGVDRAAVAAIAFRDPSERQRLEAFLHPRVEAQRRRIFDSASPGSPALVIDAPLLLEAGLADQCSEIWFIDTPEETRNHRVRASRGWSADELARRERAQWPLDRKRAAAHHVLRNDGDPASLRKQVLERLAALTRRP